MNAKEAMVRSMETQKRLVQEQLKDVHKLIEEAVDEGNFNTRAHSHSISSTRSVGWLDDVVEELRGEGYTVQLTDGTLIVSWGEVEEEPKRTSLDVTKGGSPVYNGVPQLPSSLIKEGSKGVFEVARPGREPNMIKEDEDGMVGKVLIFATILSVLFVLMLRWMLG